MESTIEVAALSHHTGVIDQGVQWAFPPFDERLNRAAVGQLQWLDEDVGACAVPFD